MTATAIAPNLVASPIRRSALLDAPGPGARPGPGLPPCAARTCTTARSSRWTTGRAMSWPTSAAPGTPRDKPRSRRFEPKYDAAGDGRASLDPPSSPSSYAAGRSRPARLTPGSLLLASPPSSTVARTGPRATPTSPTAARYSSRRALQYSLNIPAIRAPPARRQRARGQDGGARWASASPAAAPRSSRPAWPAPSGTVEVSAVRSSTSAYGTLGNGGVLSPPRMVLSRSATRTVAPPGRAETRGQEGDTRPRRAYLVTHILPATPTRVRTPSGPRAPAPKDRGPALDQPAAKTGTTNDARNLGTYGLLLLTKDGVGLVVGQIQVIARHPPG